MFINISNSYRIEIIYWYQEYELGEENESRSSRARTSPLISFEYTRAILRKGGVSFPKLHRYLVADLEIRKGTSNILPRR